jgi:DNA-binding transcriptional MocR family regulator
LDRKVDDPLYLQLARAIGERIRAGKIRVGAKLPSTRDAATKLHVNRVTIVEAYRALREEGWVRSGVGAGTFVVSPDGADGGDGARSHEGGTSGNADDAASGGSNRLNLGGVSFWASRLGEMPRPDTNRSGGEAKADTIRLTSPTADPAAFPFAEFREVLDEILRREGAACLDYGPHDGYAPLRVEIAEHLARKGVRVDPTRILLVNGSQQGLDLAFRLLAGNGRTLIVEEPTYHLALRAARALALSVRGVPVDEEGLRVDRLERLLDETNPGLLYMMPVFQNPTGVSLSPSRRKRLLTLTAERRLPILEDHFDAELDYRGDAPPPLLGEGPRHPENVLLLGTFSKILFPGLRVGWLVVPEPLIGPFSEMKVCSDLSGGLLTQMALYEFCKRGFLEAHLARIRERNRGRLDATLDALASTMPAGVRWSRPTGGMCIWVRLPHGTDGDFLAAEAHRRGVAVSPGSAFYPNAGEGRAALRISFVRESEDRIRAGIRILSDTIREEIARSGARESEGAAAPIL